VFLIVGVLVVIGAVVGGYLMEGGNLLVLVQPAEFIIIGGAAIGSMLIATPPAILKRLVGQLTGLLGGSTGKTDYMDLLAMLYQLFKAAQQSGVMGLEAHFEKSEASAIMSKYPKFLARHHAVDFLADSVKVIIIGGIGPHDFENLMDLDLEVRHHEAAQPAATLNKVADAMPGLGIVAAVLGVVITMGVIDGPPAEIGHKVGAALVGTFLGILMSYGFMQPMATNMELRVQAEGYYEQCIKSGLLAMYKGFSPMVSVEFARRVLPDEVRPNFDETEKLCKGVRSEAAGAAAA
jgi:chemotaxis protein MotA